MKELIDGIELIGRTKDSGYRDDFYIIKTPQKRYIQLSELLFLTVAAMQRDKNPAAVATQISAWLNKEIDAHAVQYLIDVKLEPLGLINDPHIIFQPTKKQSLPHAPDMLHALKYRVTLLPEKIVQMLAALYSPLFHTWVMYVVLTGVAIVNVWLFGFHGISDSLKQVLYEPMLFLGIFGLIILASLFHEIGHAAGAYFGGSKPGKIGAGLYLIWPAFYTDITDVYRLGRIARIRSDFGGVYFNLVFSLAITLVYFMTKFEPLLLLIVIQNIAVFHQLLPFLRLDGYFIVSDIVGVPDLFTRIGPILKSIVFRTENNATKDLKPWVKWTVTSWVILTIPIFTVIIGYMIISAPNIFASAFSSASIQLNIMAASFQQREYLITGVRALQLMILLLPAVGVCTILYLLSKPLVHKINSKVHLPQPRGFFET